MNTFVAYNSTTTSSFLHALLFVCNSTGNGFDTSIAEGQSVCYADVAAETLLFLWILTFAFVETCRKAPDEYVKEFLEECAAERASEGFSSLKKLDDRRQAFHRRISGDTCTLTWTILVICRFAITFCYGGTAFAVLLLVKSAADMEPNQEVPMVAYVRGFVCVFSAITIIVFQERARRQGREAWGFNVSP